MGALVSAGRSGSMPVLLDGMTHVSPGSYVFSLVVMLVPLSGSFYAFEYLFLFPVPLLPGL
jgi:hypothetical protein